MIQERVDSEWREGQRIPILVFAGSWKGSRRLHKTALPLLGWQGAVRLKGHECQLCCLTCFSRERCCGLCLAAWVAAREFRSLGVQLPKALAPAVFNLCFGTTDGWVPQQHLARDRRMTACGSHPTPCRASTGMWAWCREHGAGSGPDLAQVAAKPPQLYTQLGQRDWIMNVCSKASLKVKQ